MTGHGLPVSKASATGVPDYGPWDYDFATHPHRPIPDPATGHLLVDPEISIKALGVGIDISFYYSSPSNLDAQCGKQRSCDAFEYIATFSDLGTDYAGKVTGAQDQYVFQKIGTSGSATTYSNRTVGCETTLVYDTSSLEFTEYYPDGRRVDYAALVAGETVFGTTLFNIKRVVDAVGNANTYSYTVISSVPYLESIQVPGGNLVTFGYISGGPTSLLRYVQDWAARRWTFTYDIDRQLVTMTLPTGCATSYAYTNLNTGMGGSPVTMLYSITDPRGFETSYVYDNMTDKRVVSMCLGTAVWNYSYIDADSSTVVTNPAGGKTTFTFDGNGNVTSITTPDGVVETMTYDAFGYLASSRKPLGVSTSWTHNQFGQVTTLIDALGKVTSFEYDQFQNLTTVTDALGQVTTMIYTDGVTTADKKRLFAVVDPLGNRTTHTYTMTLGLRETTKDARLLVTTFNYDAIGNLASIVTSDGGIVTNQYDSLNRLVMTTDPLGRSTSFTYDDADNITSKAGPYTIAANAPRWTYVFNQCLMVAEVDPLGNRTSSTYGRYSNRLTLEDALNNVTSFDYDNMGYMTKVTDALGFSMVYGYDNSKRLTMVTDQLGFQTTYAFDAAGRQTTVTDARGNAVYTGYDGRNNVTIVTDALGKSSTFGYDDLGRQIRATDPLGNSSQTVFDEAGRVKATIDPLGNRTTFSFNKVGGVVTVMDANGNISTNTYAATSNRLVSVTDANGNTTGYEYDLAGQQTTITDPAGGQISMTYTAEGWRRTIANQLNKITTTSYDKKGRPVTVMNARSRVKTIDYDAMDRIVSVLYADSTRATFGYDAIGRRTTMVDWGGTTTFVFSKRGELTDQTLPGSLRLRMTYDAVGNRVTLIDPDGGVYTFVFDALNRIASTIDPGGGVTTIAYDDAGRRTGCNLPNGSRRTYGYDLASRLTTQIEFTAGGAPFMTMVDTYDNVGNRTRRDKDGVVTTWVMDDAYRLTNQLTSGGFATFGYDSRGNLSSKHHQGSNAMAFTVDAANRLVTMLQGTARTTYTFDDNGNMVHERQPFLSTSFTYDDEDRLVEEINNSAIPPTISTYSYSADGLRRTSKNSGGVVTTFVWDGTDYLQERT